MDYHSSIANNTGHDLSEDAAIPTSQATPFSIAVHQASAAARRLTVAVCRPRPGNYPGLPPFPTPAAPTAPVDVPSPMPVPVSTIRPLASPRIPPPPSPPPQAPAPPPTATSPRIVTRWTQQEKDTVADLMRTIIRENVIHGVGRRWEVIAERLEGRTATAIKTFWIKRGRAAYGIDERLSRGDGEKADETEDESTKVAKARKRRLPTPPSPPPTKYRKHDEDEDDDDGKSGDLQASRQPGLSYRSDIPAGRS